MAQKIPPPPQLTDPDWQAFNRWLLEVTSVLSNEGGINPDEVTGLPGLFIAVAGNTADIVTLEAAQGDQAGSIAALQTQVNNIDGTEIPAINGQLTSLGARAQVLNGAGAPGAGLGNVNDWYANIGGGVGARIYVKTGVATWTAFPF